MGKDEDDYDERKIGYGTGKNGEEEDDEGDDSRSANGQISIAASNTQTKHLGMSRIFVLTAA